MYNWGRIGFASIGLQWLARFRVFVGAHGQEAGAVFLVIITA